MRGVRFERHQGLLSLVLADILDRRAGVEELIVACCQLSHVWVKSIGQNYETSLDNLDPRDLALDQAVGNGLGISYQ